MRQHWDNFYAPNVLTFAGPTNVRIIKSTTMSTNKDTNNLKTDTYVSPTGDNVGADMSAIDFMQGHHKKQHISENETESDDENSKKKQEAKKVNDDEEEKQKLEEEKQ
jgi:hypothetical protein